MITDSATKLYRTLVAGVEKKIPLANGRMVPAINFDNAATTPPFISVLEAINEFAPWYSSIHRGAGYKSKYSTRTYEIAREIVASFVGADLNHDVVIFVKNTTEAINKLSCRLQDEIGKNGVVLTTYMEHHSNDLPWRMRYRVDYVNVDEKGRLCLEDLKAKLQKYGGAIKLVAVAGASNVTGYVNPIHEIAEIAHHYGAKIAVDGAQLVPHMPIAMEPISSSCHIDFLAFSAHKMYAPFGIGVLIGPRTVFEKGEPEFPGGGTVDIVTPDYVQWSPPPKKEESGTPNLMGVVALTAAIKTIQSLGMEKIHQHELKLTRYAIEQLLEIPDVQLYCNVEDFTHRVGIIPFNIDGLHHALVAEALSLEAGIAVRSGCFCAQPYIQKLLKIPSEEVKKRISGDEALHPGVVRVSFGLYNQKEEVDVLISSIKKMAANKKEYKNKYRFI